ncbi:MAG TPA: hypothetical protein VM911_08610 [Pyrinomonadaceae bacterium]|jgi:hypothetical protein|nr:hypothetical protein [Pyrinomonadaceae bacterium]
MRRLPVLHHEDFVYTRLKALAWVANETVLPTVLQADAGKALSQLFNEVEPNKPLVINCRGINVIDDHALDSIRGALQPPHRTLVLVNAGELKPQLDSALGRYDLYNVGGITVMVPGDAQIERATAARIIEQFPELEQKNVKNFVRDCFRPYPDGEMHRMASTPLLASGIFDARPLISDPERFVWVSMLMADRLEKYLDAGLGNAGEAQGSGTTDKPKNFRLLAVSLRGSPLTAAVGLLTGRQDIEIVDHMGPKYKILEEHSLRLSAGSEDYIYVGDFVVGGTELRVAQAYARSKGATLRHAVVIGCRLDPDEYQLDMGISYLVKLEECCPTAKFQFIK